MVDVREAAEMVGRTPETVRRWVWTHRLDAVKHGNKLMVRRDALLELDPKQTAAQRGRAASGLRAWADDVARSSTAGRPGASAADLVVGDRSARQDGGGHAGR